MKFCKYRRTLVDCLATEKEVNGIEDIAKYCSTPNFTFDPDKLIIEKDNYDIRVKKNRDVVLYPDFGIIGWIYKELSINE